jgi:hypothetical protein
MQPVLKLDIAPILSPTNSCDDPKKGYKDTPYPSIFP